MPRQLKVSAFLTFLLAVLFYLFFQISKHNPALSQVNAFGEDPYDAVGSFAIQCAAFTALLALLRAFRPYQYKKAFNSQQVLLVRAAYITCLSVAVTLLADIIAMIRHPSMWMSFSAGQVLAALVGALAVLTALIGWFIYRSVRTIIVPPVSARWKGAIGICLVGILLLALYPENWRQSIHGELLTVLVGTVFLFILVRILGLAISPSLETQFEDAIDDLASVYRWLKAHAGPFRGVCTFFERLLNLPFIRALLRALNPRKHTWNAILLLGLLAGAALSLGELMSEGGGPSQINRFALIAAIYISLEDVALLLGYALLAKPLGLFRQDSNNTLSQQSTSQMKNGEDFRSADSSSLRSS